MRVTGWRAIALPVTAQVIALSIRVYGLFWYVPQSERILTIVVLLIAVVQIIVTRPRASDFATDDGNARASE